MGGFILRILSADPTPEEPAHRVAGPVSSGQAGLITRPKSWTMRAKRKNVREPELAEGRGTQMSSELESDRAMDRAMVVMELCSKEIWGYWGRW